MAAGHYASAPALSIRLVRFGRGRDGRPLSSVFWWIILDGTPVPSRCLRGRGHRPPLARARNGRGGRVAVLIFSLRATRVAPCVAPRPSSPPDSAMGRPSARGFSDGPARTRTWDQRIMSPLL